MKIRKVDINTRQKAFIVTTTTSILPYPFSKLRQPPSTRDPIVRVYADPELGFTGFTYVLKSGKEDSIVLDQVLEYNRDPEFLRKMLLHKMTVHAMKLLDRTGASRREVIRRMNSSPTQFYRLIDPAFYSKTIDQMILLLSALDCNVDYSVAKRDASSSVFSSNEAMAGSRRMRAVRATLRRSRQLRGGRAVAR